MPASKMIAVAMVQAAAAAHVIWRRDKDANARKQMLRAFTITGNLDAHSP